MNTFLGNIPVIILGMILMCAAASEADAHRAFGIYYPDRAAEQLDSNEIDELRNAGITWLMVREALSDTTRRNIHSAGLSLLVMVPKNFPTPRRLMNNQNDYIKRSDALLRYYRDDPAVKGFGLFAFGDWRFPALGRMLQAVAEPHLNGRTLFTLDTRPFSGENLAPFDGIVMLTRNAEQLGGQLANRPDLTGILYAPRDRELDLRDFQDLLRLLDDRRELPVFFPRNWYFQNTANDEAILQNDIRQITDFYYRVENARIANPAPDASPWQANWSLLLLFLFWGVYAVYYRLNPIYRKSVVRFFLNYEFFVNDVLMRRIRFTVDTIIVMLFTCFLSGLTGYAFANFVFYPVSQQALLHYTPLIPMEWAHPVTFFVIFFLGTLIVLCVMTAWLRVANYRHAEIWQIAAFIVWPHHLNFLVVTAGVLLLRTYPGATVAVGMISIFWAITLISFFTAAYNMRRIQRTSPFYMMSTYALFVLVMALALSWMIFGIDIDTVWSLAVSLSAY